ncbi:MAG TPA: SagB/ThcOx family dehydrogenase [Aggregatilinea sp.]|jgi:SagB-type dehydrogenase family enzyme|uniref:SagB/ThcOx family dehydrogenase n=1 Tax=Aggregatilinea sp. TaxID=2806333 RepID=UPI002CF56B1D|nr:SagB/ThcOx family dehydrogenase [Aggregatilinea sp.]HML21497.1 SagB/ThcOx family dehydrogenase [Aggregatilinea sp.]
MPTDPGHDFLTASQHKHLDPTGQAQGLPQPPLEWPFDPDAPQIPLPDPAPVAAAPVVLRELIEARTTHRRYTADPLALTELAYLLRCTQGVKPTGTAAITKRTVPSAGSRHPYETHLIVNRVEGLEPGLYRYLALENTLIRLPAPDDLAQRATETCGKQLIADAAVTFVWAVVHERVTWVYGTRGYRYLFLDAGHICQNLYLAAESIDCGVCAIASFDDDALNALLGFDGTEMFVTYMGSVGKI